MIGTNFVKINSENEVKNRWIRVIRMVKIIQTDKIIKSEVIQWINKCRCLHSLQSIRAKTNKRIKIIMSPAVENPLKDIPTEKKREILKDLFI